MNFENNKKNLFSFINSCIKRKPDFLRKNAPLFTLLQKPFYFTSEYREKFLFKHGLLSETEPSQGHLLGTTISH